MEHLFFSNLLSIIQDIFIKRLSIFHREGTGSEDEPFEKKSFLFDLISYSIDGEKETYTKLIISSSIIFDDKKSLKEDNHSTLTRHQGISSSISSKRKIIFRLEKHFRRLSQMTQLIRVSTDGRKEKKEYFSLIIKYCLVL